MISDLLPDAINDKVDVLDQFDDYDDYCTTLNEITKFSDVKKSLFGDTYHTTNPSPRIR